MKRFTETLKWRDPWFRNLSCRAKLLFFWLLDNCDNAGVIDLDLKAAAFDIGQPVEERHLTEIQSRLQRLADGKWWITKFVTFQYGPLSEGCLPHRRVIASLKLHTTLDGSILTTLLARVQGTDKEKEKEEEGGVGGFRRPTVGEVKLAAAKSGLPESEALKFFDYYESNGWKVGRNKMRSMPHAVANWKRNYDDRNQKGGGRNNSTPGTEIILHQKEYERILDRLRVIRGTYSGHQTWSREDREESKKLVARRDLLRSQLGIVI